MRTFAKLFGRSPIEPLQAHMAKVTQCVERVGMLIDAMREQRYDDIERLAKEVSTLEHEADQIKHDIQAHLPRSLFVALDRDRLLEILSIQDSIADKAENLGALLTLKRLKMLPALEEPFTRFLAKNLEAFEGARRIIDELDELLETGFGGGEAEKVLQMVDHVARTEHEVDLVQHELLKLLFAHEDELSVGDFYLWTRVFKQLSDLSNLSERLAHRVRRTLDLKS